MNHRILEDLYDATEEDLLFGVGLLALPDQEPAPLIHIHYRDWPREKLEIVRESFRAGIILVSGRRANGSCDFYIGTREKIAIQATHNGHTSALRAPAWDAHLAKIDEQIARRFEADRHRCGGFLLLVQSPEWKFIAAVDDIHRATRVGTVTPGSFTAPRECGR